MAMIGLKLHTMQDMESTIRGEAVVIWRSQASFDLMMMMLTRLLYLAVEIDGI